MAVHDARLRAVVVGPAELTGEVLGEQHERHLHIHLAAAEGNAHVIDALVAAGANVNIQDRWGNTALQDAINNNQGPVIQLLVQWKSELNNENAAGRLCDAASAGDLDTLKLILEHGVDPNCGEHLSVGSA